MSTLNKLNFEGIFEQDAEEIIQSRKKAKTIHNSGDIRASGNEVEIAVRKFLKSRMPSNYYVGHGHTVDSKLNISPQFDVLISDIQSTPVLLKTNDSTEYFPFESLYAIGEIKSTYYKSKKPIDKFCKSIKKLKTEMIREEIKNTIQNKKITKETTIKDIFINSPNKILNPLYTFMLFVDSGKFDFKEFKDAYKKYGIKYMPNHIIFLDKGVIFFGGLNDKTLVFEIYPEYPDNSKTDGLDKWIFTPWGKNENKTGNHLGFMYYCLLNHLNRSSMEPVNIKPYFEGLFTILRSSVQEIEM